jgi:hypothetical protein
VVNKADAICHTGSMAYTTVPAPKENGLYSTSLPEDFERLFIQNVQNKLAVENFEPEVGEGNAGQLLFVIGKEAVKFGNLLKWPDSLSTLESCNDYLECKPDFWRLLAEVHQKTAYAWLIENGMIAHLLVDNALTLCSGWQAADVA